MVELQVEKTNTAITHYLIPVSHSTVESYPTISLSLVFYFPKILGTYHFFFFFYNIKYISNELSKLY